MPRVGTVEEILIDAQSLERKYEWLEAAGLYKQVEGMLGKKELMRMSEIQARIGFCLYKAAFQAENQEEFRQRLRHAIEAYEKANHLYAMLSGPKNKPETRCFEAMRAYLSYWLATETSERKRLIDECWKLTKEVLENTRKSENASDYGKTFNLVSSSAYHKFVLEWDFETGGKTIREAMEYGEHAITLLSSIGDPQELAMAYAKTAIYLGWFGWSFSPYLDQKERHYSKARDYWRKATELSEETALLALLSIFNEGEIWNINEMLVHYEKALKYAQKTRDKLLIGTALDWLAYATFLSVWTIEDPDQKKEVAERALNYAENAKRNFSSISFKSSRGGPLWTAAPHAWYRYRMALSETNFETRRGLLEKAIEDGTYAVTEAEDTGYPFAAVHAHSILSRAQLRLAQIESTPAQKKQLLQDALVHHKESIGIAEHLYRFHYANLASLWYTVADLKAELSNIEKSPQEREKVIQEAISDKQRGLQLTMKEAPLLEKMGESIAFRFLGQHQYSYGELLNRLYALTGNTEHLTNAIKAFEEAAESLQKLNMASRVAECYWKAARCWNTIDNHLKAAESFNLASDNYMSAAEKIPQLKDFYRDHGVYMQAWSEIERARHDHERQDYNSAKEHFVKAADLHRSLKQWSYLGPNYSAWSKVEYAEELSRREQSEEAIKAFEQASGLFSETEKSLQTQLTKIEEKDEKQMAANMIKASHLRRDYCIARIVLEEARILDKKGDHFFSSRKYGSAAEAFEKITAVLAGGQEQRELRLFVILSRAWERMTGAESEASPTLYAEASQLFEEAKDFGQGDRVKMLMLGHSRFCKALEAGTKFADTRDPEMYVEATKLLGSAANYYNKADFRNVSEYAKATKLLFDAYLYMDNAQKEVAPDKKAKLYVMAEKVLQTSAGSFMKAEHPEKREQVLRLLNKVVEERELALSLNEMLHVPSIVSATAAFATPTPTHENPVGLERFENADIQANVIARQTELNVGENLNLEIELVNAGKGPALLTKITEIIPEGFELIEKPSICRVEDSYLDMKGRRLDPLKTEEIRLLLKPKVQGKFTLNPKVLYLDENGRYKSHEPGAISIIIKELGIRGWLKGER